MYVIETTDVNNALQRGIEYLLREGIEEPSRNGQVIVAPGPVCTAYRQPRNRVLYSATRDANPFFHFMESLWILSGANDVEFVEYFAKQMRAYSDDGVTSWGAYGWRWRNFFGYDQLELIIAELRSNAASRRCVLTMWNAWPMAGDYDQNREMNREKADLHDHDLHVATHGGMDVPCNTHAYVDTRGGKLNLTICNRSNDIIWGCYGANAVHMSFLQEYLAMRVGVPIGTYYQFSNNYHAYTNVFSREKMDTIAVECDTLGWIPDKGPAIEPGFDEDLKKFMEEARRFISGQEVGTAAFMHPMNYHTELFQKVAVPMFAAWYARKQGRHEQAMRNVEQIGAPDWQRACREWIERRTK